MRTCRPRGRTDAQESVAEGGPKMIVPASRHHDTPPALRQTNAIKIATHSRNSPAPVGTASVIDARFWLCGARKINGYHHANQEVINTTQPVNTIGSLTALRRPFRTAPYSPG